MNKRDWADRFSHDVDQLLHEAGLSDLEKPSTEYNDMLEVARRLSQSDFSQQSRIRQSLRRRLLNQIDESLTATVEIPGPWGLLKNFLKGERRYSPQLPAVHTRLLKSGLALAGLVGAIIILVTLLFISPAGTQLRASVIKLLVQILPPETPLVIPEVAPGELGLQWQFAGDEGLSSAPIVAGGKLYVGGNDGYLYALEAGTGQRLWRYQLADSPVAAPAVVAGMVYAGDSQGALYALEAETGVEIWQFKAGAQISTTPTVAASLIYAGSDDGYLYALDAATGREAWRFQAAGAILSRPAVFNDLLYFGSNDWHLYALDAITGREKWRFKAQDWITAAPVVDKTTGLVYAGSHDQYLYALDAATGQERWRFNAGDNIVAAATLAHDRLYFGSYDGYLYALDTATGQEQWRFWTGKAIQAAPVIVDELLYIGSGEGYLYAVEATTGQVRQQFDAGSQLYTTPAVSADAGTIYMTSGKGKLLAVRNMPGAMAQPQPLLPTSPQTYTVEFARFQFTPDPWYASANEQDDFIRFRGRIVDETGQPVNGFSVEADNGRQRLLSEPSGPGRRFPERAGGEWEIVISAESPARQWWWLTVGRSECDDNGGDFNTECQQFTRLSESVKVEVVYPDEAIINADWVCRRDCLNSGAK